MMGLSVRRLWFYGLNQELGQWYSFTVDPVVVLDRRRAIEIPTRAVREAIRGALITC